VFIQSASSAGSPYEVRAVPFLMVSSGLVGHSGRATLRRPGRRPRSEPSARHGGLAFSPPATVVDAQRTEGEPPNYIDKDGHYWDSATLSRGNIQVHE
jgi:hypothetical protein